MDIVVTANQVTMSSPRTREAGSVLALGVEIDRLTACLLEPISGSYRLGAWWTASNGAQLSMAEQLEDLCERFSKRIGRRLWDKLRGAPFVQSWDPVGLPPLQHVSITASPRPHLRTWVVGLTPRSSLASALGALEASQTQIVGTTAMHAELDIDRLAHELNASRPELLVLSGGYDSGEQGPQRSLVLMAQYVAFALEAIPDDDMPDIIFAGNPFAYRDITAVFQSVRKCNITRVNNVQPAPDRSYGLGLSRAADKLYMVKCRQMRDYVRLEQWTADATQIMPVESSFSRLVLLWLQLNDLPQLHGVYTSGERWLHVWADASTDRVLARYAEPKAMLENDSSWPSIGLVSGRWTDTEPLPDSVRWYDSAGLAPVLAAAAIVAPRATVESLRADVLVSPGEMSRTRK